MPAFRRCSTCCAMAGWSHLYRTLVCRWSPTRATDWSAPRLPQGSRSARCPGLMQPSPPFLVLGFPPPRQAARRAGFGRIRAAERAGLAATLVWYEAPHRLAETLADMADAFAGRPAAVARELTKRFEEVRRGPLAELATHYAANAARGEVTIVVGPPEQDDPEDLDGRLRAALATSSLKDAAALVATATGLPRKLVYARALALARD